MLKIWGRVNSVNVKKALWALEELGVKYERIDAGMEFGVNNTPEYLRMNARVIEIVQHFAATKKPIAAICHAAQLLTAAGVVMKGRRLSAYPACQAEIELAGGEFIPASSTFDNAYTDANLVTAPAWPAHPAWIRQFLAVLGTRIEV